MRSPSTTQGHGMRMLDEGFLRLVAVAFVLLGVILGLMQPLGSAGLGRPAAVLFWLLHGLAAIPCIVAAAMALSRAGVARRLSPMGFVISSGLLAAVALSMFALGIELAFGVGDADPDDAGAWERLGFLGLWLDELAGLTPPFLLAWILVNLPRLMRLGWTMGGPRPSAEMAAGAGQGPTPDDADITHAPAGEATLPASAEEGGLLSRLPEALGTDVVLLSSDLHYLHVHTTRGRTMILYNLADAEAELGGRGTRVHRSHWVADRHVVRLRPRSGGLAVVLTGDLTAPVSRRRQKDVVARFGRDSRYHPPGPQA